MTDKTILIPVPDDIYRILTVIADAVGRPVEEVITTLLLREGDAATHPPKTTNNNKQQITEEKNYE